MARRHPTAERITCAVLCAGALLGFSRMVAAEPASVPKPITAYAAGRTITFAPASGKPKGMLVVGDAVLGPLLHEREPKDRRPNLYIVAPGAQYRTELTDGDPINFNLVVNTIPSTDRPVDWDVYWALVLDPTIKGDFISENALLYATQNGFLPDASFSFDDLPASGVLRDYLHIDSLAGLRQFRREDGSLPRLMIVPAKLVVRASAVDPNAPPVCVPAQGTISRAISIFSRRCRKGEVPAEEVAKKPAAQKTAEEPAKAADVNKAAR